MRHVCIWAGLFIGLVVSDAIFGSVKIYETAYHQAIALFALWLSSKLWPDAK